MNIRLLDQYGTKKDRECAKRKQLKIKAREAKRLKRQAFLLKVERAGGRDAYNKRYNSNAVTFHNKHDMVKNIRPTKSR